jgi:hypothetical protein
MLSTIPSGSQCTHVSSSMSRRRTWKDIDAGWTPKLESCRCSQNAIGFDVSIVAKGGGMSSTTTGQTASWFEVCVCRRDAAKYIAQPR